MSVAFTGSQSGPRGSDLESLRSVWLCFVAMGIALILLGFAAIGSAYVATDAVVLIFGILLLVGALFQVAGAFWGRHWKGFFVHLLTGVLYLIAGVLMLEHPGQAAAALTLLIAASLLIGGLVRIVLAVAERFDGRGWVLLNGIISVMLGTAIWRQWPLSGEWVIGLFVGIEMVFNGVSWVMLGLAARSIPRTASPT